MSNFQFSKISVNNNKEIDNWANLQDQDDFSCCPCEAGKEQMIFLKSSLVQEAPAEPFLHPLSSTGNQECPTNRDLTLIDPTTYVLTLKTNNRSSVCALIQEQQYKSIFPLSKLDPHQLFLIQPIITSIITQHVCFPA